MTDEKKDKEDIQELYRQKGELITQIDICNGKLKPVNKKIIDMLNYENQLKKAKKEDTIK